MEERAARFWEAFRVQHLQVPAEPYEVFYFDDNQPSADELAALVMAGTKRATASLLWSYQAEGEPLPQVGDLSLVTDWAGEPQCVIETTTVQVVPYEQVPEAFAATEGEGDGSLAYWRRAHWACFGRECARLGREPQLDMPVVCERFEVIWRG